jgi:hypothetical protein
MTDPDTETPMPDRDDQLLELDEPYEDDWQPVEDDAAGSLPRRPRRRLVTPISAALAAVLVAALGFIGGVQVQKHEDKSSASGTGAAQNALAAARGGGNGGSGAARGAFPGVGGGAQGRTPTVGSVANKRGSTLYVKDSDSNTVRVKTTSHSKINRTASTTAGAIHPGDTVIVQGTKSKSGTITATQINATASGAAGGLAGLFGGGGGQAPGPQVQGSGG